MKNQWEEEKRTKYSNKTKKHKHLKTKHTKEKNSRNKEIKKKTGNVREYHHHMVCRGS